MKKYLVLVFSLLVLNVNTSRADEGMWMLPLIQDLNMEDMQELGIQLTAEQIYNVNNSSIKDAIVVFGGGCTGEIVSADGLLFTNHHCGYGQIQEHSTLEHDYLREGFWAMSREEELPNPGLTVRFLDRIEDVTDLITKELSDQMLEADRQDKINEVIAEIEEEASLDGKHRARVRAFYEGNQYYLFVYTEYEDVRLVGAPPSSIGKFGYDTDNWQWPRHTGDFSIFRVYTAPDGSPAKYAEENIPLKPKHFLPVSVAGVEKGDFAFILGYPGGTERYKSSFGIEETVNVTNTNRIKIRERRQEIIEEDMQADPKVRIQYASKYSRSTNYYKYSIGQNKGVKTLRVLEKKREEEAAFQKWVQADPERNALYGDVLEKLEKLYASNKPYFNNLSAIAETFFRGTEVIDIATEFQGLLYILEQDEVDEEKLTSEIENLKELSKQFYKDYSLPTDIDVNKELFSFYRTLVPAESQPDIYKVIDKKYKGDVDKYIDKMFEKTIFSDEVSVMAFLDNPSAKVLKKDMAFIAGESILKKFFETRNLMDIEALEKQQRLYLEGRMKMNPEKLLYPDANFTMRLTYGVVDDYSPADAVHYNEKTYLKGVMEKEDPDNYEFIVPEKLKELYEAKDFGGYDEDGRMPVCFITNNDITGGNSGSPVLNSRGELIGLAFDGNLEAMSGDIAFEPDIQRCINVDARYVLFIIEKYAGAGHLVEELKIVN